MKNYVIFFISVLVLIVILVNTYRFLMNRVFVGSLFATDGVRKRRIHIRYTNMTLLHTYVDISISKRIESYGYYTNPVEELSDRLKSMGWTIVEN